MPGSALQYQQNIPLSTSRDLKGFDFQFKGKWLKILDSFHSFLLHCGEKSIINFGVSDNIGIGQLRCQIDCIETEDISDNRDNKIIRIAKDGGDEMISNYFRLYSKFSYFINILYYIEFMHLYVILK